MHFEPCAGRLFIGRFNKCDDLCNALTDFCVKNNILAGTFFVIGAVTKACIGYYSQSERKYVNRIVRGDLEITSCDGNISLKDSQIFVHAHINLSDSSGAVYGGHLMVGAEVFAAEFFIQELTNVKLDRAFDAETGLALWNKEEGGK
ncbi:MAG: PPC domain-containing DNA-binding protein [Candidatus Omnitrophota bacterium]